MSPIQAYLESLNQVRTLARSASPERSFYPALQALLAAIGDTLAPKVYCVQELADAGAGRPDFGLFVANQLSLDDMGRNPIATLPERGVIEAKAPSHDIQLVAGTQQVTDYWQRYGLVLVTNFRSFLVVARDEHGRLVHRERFDFAESEPAFWTLCARASRLPKDLEVRATEFLTRVLLHNAPLSRPQDVAFFLASFAKDCLWRLESLPRLQAENPMRRYDNLSLVRESLEAALGIRFDSTKGLHFFHSTLVQTLFYGLFSAWVIWYRLPPDRGRAPTFSAEGAAWNLKLPVLRGLFEQVYRPGALDGLGIRDVLNWAADVLRRVDGTAFFARFQEDRAVQYFYEPFLESFDPDLRKQLGVWYTPPEVVDYMVERVDQALRHELGIELGLADDRVHVLDPCCGTGSFILSVLVRVARTLSEQGDDALLGVELKRAAMTRIHGFEIMAAPFVVAHLQVSLLLAQRYGVPLDDAGGHTRNRDEWASIYLCNALTGHDPRYDRQIALPLPDLQAEVDTANRLKREAPILVILGNPPYNGFAGVAVSEEELALAQAYRRTRDPNLRQPEGQGLNDLYVRFWRMAERRIAEQTGCGVVCLITNYSWLDGLSYTALREHFLDRFDGLWIDCLNGDKFKTGKKTPDGRPDPSIFSTPQNREGIQVGTAIGLAVRRGAVEPVLERGPGFTRYEEYDPLPVDPEPRRGQVRFRHFWGPDKLKHLAALAQAHHAHPHGAALASPSPHRGEGRGEGVSPQAPPAADPLADIPNYELLSPDPALGLPFVPASANPAYFTWPSLPDLMPFRSPGVTTGRDDFLVDIDRDNLESRIRDYLNPDITDQQIESLYPSAFQASAGYNPKEARTELILDGFRTQNLVRIAYRPFDTRWIYYFSKTKIIDRNRTEYFERLSASNRWLGACQKNRKESDPLLATCLLGAYHIIERGTVYFPMYTKESDTLFGASGLVYSPNLTISAKRYIDQFGQHYGDVEALFYHTLAITHSRDYRLENADPLRQDWPRIPLPRTAEALAASAALGRQVADLLDPDRPVPGVTVAPLRPAIKAVGLLRGGLNSVGRNRGEAPYSDGTPTRPSDYAARAANPTYDGPIPVGRNRGEAPYSDGPPAPARPSDPAGTARLNLTVTAGWGHAGQNGVCMPGRGLVRERPWTELERAALALEARALGLTEDTVLALLGPTCLDIHLNPTTAWTAVPAAVWRFTIGGYQVLKKWLSYREHSLLGRPLTDEEAKHFRTVTRRLTALVLLGPGLDGNYQSCTNIVEETVND